MALDVFVELSVIVVIATIIAGIIKLLKQPLIIGYIITGLLVSPLFLNLIHSTEILQTFSHMGVAFLLFIVGINLSPKIIKEVGVVSLITGIGQVIFTSLIGFFISRWLGFSIVTSLYIAVALTFSSTIIIMKILSDKKDLETLYGKISIGFLLVQDIIAVIVLIVVSSFSSGTNITNLITDSLIKGVSITAAVIVIANYILPKLSDFFAKSQEYLFLFSISWGLGLATLFHFLNFSIEIGALIAGVTLSLSPYHQEISSKMKVLRDFFIIIFFVLLGSQLVFGNINQYIIPTIIFSLFILIGNPLIVMVLMGINGYSKRVSFLSGLTVAQISEFSLILIALGVSLGHLSKEILSLVTIIGLITIAGSTYLMLYSEKIYQRISNYLLIFEKKDLKKIKKDKSKDYDIILFGYNRIGYDFLKSFEKINKKFMVIDYNPRIIEELTNQNVSCEYGDADDVEFLNELKLSKAKMIVSTIPTFETNSLIVDKIRKHNKKAIVIVVSHDIEEAITLYEKGASYVLMPHFLGGHYASLMINKYGLSGKKFSKERKTHIKHLKLRKTKGQEHPKHETIR